MRGSLTHELTIRGVYPDAPCSGKTNRSERTTPVKVIIPVATDVRNAMSWSLPMSVPIDGSHRSRMCGMKYPSTSAERISTTLRDVPVKWPPVRMLRATQEARLPRARAGCARVAHALNRPDRGQRPDRAAEALGVIVDNRHFGLGRIAGRVAGSAPRHRAHPAPQDEPCRYLQ